MKRRKKLVFATNNPHKLKEARQILSEWFDVVGLSEIGCTDEIEETADTLEGNALIKARWVHDKYNVDCFADDTGLMVDALGGGPGVYTARYAGEHCSPADNVAKMLRELKDEKNRKAHFATVVALISDGREHCFEGRVEGSIAESAGGSKGFGYDPIFVPDETGIRFSEMAPEEKNAISHRGRAMRKLKDFLVVLITIVCTVACNVRAFAEEWRLYPSYDGKMDRIIDTADYTYFLGLGQTYNPDNMALSNKYGFLFRYDKSGDEMQYLNKLNALTSDNVQQVEYNFEKKYLLVAYVDGSIDLLFDNGKVYSIDGLKIADSSFDKRVNSIAFDATSNRAYVATRFGYMAIDDEKMELAFSRTFGVAVNAVAPLGDKLIIATPENAYVTEATEFDMDNMTPIPDSSKISRLIPLGKDYLYAFTYDKGRKMLFSISSNGGAYVCSQVSKQGEVNAERTRDGILLATTTELRLLEADGSSTFFPLPVSDRGSICGSYDGRDIWMSADRKGISLKRIAPDGSGNWSVRKDRFFPNASSAYMCAYIEYHPDYGMLVRNHGFDVNFNASYGNVYSIEDLVSAYKDMNWSRLSTAYRVPDMKGLKTDNPNGIAIDPMNPQHIYHGSNRNGFFRLDLENPANSIHMSKPSDIMGGSGEQGFVVAVPDHSGAWKEQCSFLAPAFDNAGNLWTSYVDPDGVNGSSADATIFWIWTPEDRAAVTSTSTYRPFRKLKVNDMPCSAIGIVSPLKSPINKNIVLLASNSGNTGSLLVLDHQGTIENASDDKVAIMRTLYDQDGLSIEWYRVKCLYEDPATGLVWVGLPDGVITFNPQEAFSNPQAARRVKVARNDGTNLADYLLDQVGINQIISDSQGRKWFATIGAGLVCTSSDGREILKTYTKANSPLPGDNVYAICLNPETNSIMMSTDQGLCELFLGSAAAESGDGVRVYPNPVRPDYYGYVTIDNLPDDTTVKIVDTAGNLVKECGYSAAGEVKWDVTNIHHKRVPGGVYFVMAASGKEVESYAKVGKVLVIN